jgi:hypothetical protein
MTPKSNCKQNRPVSTSGSAFFEAVRPMRGLSMSEIALKFQIRWLVILFCLSVWVAIACWLA